MSPKPFTESSTHHYDPNCDCRACFHTEQRRLNAHYGYEEPSRVWRGIRNALLLSILIWGLIAAGAIWYLATSRAQEGVIHPVPAPQELLRARQACPNDASIVQCRSALVRAYRGVAWQRHARMHQGAFGVEHALRLASALYGVPINEMRAVGNCESHLTPTSQNSSSTAAGVFQFLDSTWARAGIPGFSVYDAYANIIAAARLWSTDGHSWHEWSCQP